VLTDKCCAIYLKFFGVEIIMALAPHPSPRHKEKKKLKGKVPASNNMEITLI
jgi:hypothetical protein